MYLERRAFYTSLRMHWLRDQRVDVEPWQVEDYRVLRLEEIFDRLYQCGIDLERMSFAAYAESFDTPEDLTDFLLESSQLADSEQDWLYLLVFELWRRLLPEKPCISVLCEELDYQINLYDQGKIESEESLQDVLENLRTVLEENADQGVNPLEVFVYISSGCANDLEDFLYDFIADQIDSRHYSYASDLLEGFEDYVSDVKWFDFLRVRLLAVSDPEGTNILVKQLVEDAMKESDLEFNLELLSFLVQEGERGLFVKLAKHSLLLIKLEEDFQDFLELCADYYHCLDFEDKERKIKRILEGRSHNHLKTSFSLEDSDLAEVKQVLANA